jgi:preprotein translocase subunit SecG
MIYVLALLHTVLCIALIGMILLHSGKGGGLSSSMGGGLGGTFSGTTVMEKNLTRLTLIIIALFTLSTMGLIFLG